MAARTVLCFGDSNTHGTRAMRFAGDRRRWDRADRWPNVMAATLGPDWEVIAEGHPGRTTVHEDPLEGPHKSGARVLMSLLESHRPIDLVIVTLGTNDLKARFDLTADDITQGVLQLARMVAASDAGPDGGAPSVLLTAPVAAIEAGCLAQMFAGSAPKSKGFAARLAAAAKTHGFGFVDFNQVAQVDPVDGIHLGKPAHAAIGALMAQSVTDHMTEREDVRC